MTATEPKTFNMNNVVRVRLTPPGRKVLVALHQRPVEEDADGWSRWQLWDLLTVFGPVVKWGWRRPFEPVIRLGDE